MLLLYKPSFLVSYHGAFWWDRRTRKGTVWGGRASSVAYRGWTWSFCSRIAAPPSLCGLEQAASSFLGLIFTTGQMIPGPLTGWLPDSELVCVGKAFRLPPDQRRQSRACPLDKLCFPDDSPDHQGDTRVSHRSRSIVAPGFKLGTSLSLQDNAFYMESVE